MERGEAGRYEVKRIGGEALRARPILPLGAVAGRTGLSFPAAASAMDLLVQPGVSRELTGKRRNRLFVYHHYLEILSEGTEPL